MQRVQGAHLAGMCANEAGGHTDTFHGGGVGGGRGGGRCCKIQVMAEHQVVATALGKVVGFAVNFDGRTGLDLDSS